VESGGWTTQSLAPPSGKRDVDYFIGRQVRSESLILKQAHERSAEVARKRCKDMVCGWPTGKEVNLFRLLRIAHAEVVEAGIIDL
jgi:hypothetical protein